MAPSSGTPPLPSHEFPQSTYSPLPTALSTSARILGPVFSTLSSLIQISPRTYFLALFLPAFPSVLQFSPESLGNACHGRAGCFSPSGSKAASRICSLIFYLYAVHFA